MIATGRKQAESGGVQAEGDQLTKRPGEQSLEGQQERSRGRDGALYRIQAGKEKGSLAAGRKGFRGGSRVECWEEPQVLNDPGRAAITLMG